MASLESTTIGGRGKEKRLLDGASKPEPVETIVIRCDLGSNIPLLSVDKLAGLISDIHENPNENPRHTLIRHLAGELRGDISDHFGPPLDSQLTLTSGCEFLLTFHYPKSIWRKTSVVDFNRYLAGRAEHWVKHFVALLLQRATSEGDTDAIDILQKYNL